MKQINVLAFAIQIAYSCKMSGESPASPVDSGEYRVFEINSTSDFADIPSEALSLRFVGNEIKRVPDLVDFPNLRSLSFIGVNTSLVKASTAMLAKNTRLETLEIRACGLTDFPVSGSDLSRLQELLHLDLSGNRLVVLPSSLWTLGNLNTLRAAMNEIEEIPSGLSKLKSLKVLDLSGNRIEFVDLGMMDNGALVELWLGGNDISVIVGAFKSSLSLLDLSSNRLRECPGQISQLEGLTTLHLYWNYFAKLPIENRNLLELVISDYMELSDKEKLEDRGTRIFRQ